MNSIKNIEDIAPGRRQLPGTATMSLIAAGVVVMAAILAASSESAISAAQDKYAVQVPKGLSFAEFRGFEDWASISVSQSGDLIEVILGNPKMIAAYRSGIPGNGKPFPNGSKMAKIHWNKKQRMENNNNKTGESSFSFLYLALV